MVHPIVHAMSVARKGGKPIPLTSDAARVFEYPGWRVEARARKWRKGVVDVYAHPPARLGREAIRSGTQINQLNKDEARSAAAFDTSELVERLKAHGILTAEGVPRSDLEDLLEHAGILYEAGDLRPRSRWLAAKPGQWHMLPSEAREQLAMRGEQLVDQEERLLETFALRATLSVAQQQSASILHLRRIHELNDEWRALRCEMTRATRERVTAANTGQLHALAPLP